MLPSQSSQSMYDQLMDINKQVFEQKYYEVAYHVLAAALHCAISLQQEAALPALEQRACEQRDWLDAVNPWHPLSSQSAAARGHAGVYTTLVKLIQTRKRMRPQSLLMY